MSANQTHLPMPPIVDIETWKSALQEQEKLEQQLQEHQEIVAAARRRMPMTPVQGDYTFTGPEGDVTFADLFAGHRQLAVYHFMYSPDWSKGCPHCTQYARLQGPGLNDVIGQRDIRFILTSRAPYEKIAAWAQEKGISTPWYSAPTAFSEEMGVINDSFGDFPGITIFYRDDENTVYRTLKASGTAVESTMPSYGIMRMVPYGTQEKGEDSPEGWPQRFDPLG